MPCTQTYSLASSLQKCMGINTQTYTHEPLCVHAHIHTCMHILKTQRLQNLHETLRSAAVVLGCDIFITRCWTAMIVKFQKPFDPQTTKISLLSRKGCFFSGREPSCFQVDIQQPRKEKEGNNILSCLPLQPVEGDKPGEGDVQPAHPSIVQDILNVHLRVPIFFH